MQPTPLASAPSPQQQEQKNEKIINLGTDSVTNSFITSTCMVPDLQRRLREGKLENLVIAPLELSPPTPILLLLTIIITIVKKENKQIYQLKILKKKKNLRKIVTI